MNKVIDKQGKEIHGECFHPGIILKEEIKERGYSQENFAILIDVKQSYINYICNCKRDINVSLALKLEKALEISAEFWLSMQTSYNLYIARKEQNKE